MAKFKRNKILITSNFRKALAYWVFLTASYGYYISSTDSKLTMDLRLVNNLIESRETIDHRSQKEIIKALLNRFQDVTGRPLTSIDEAQLTSISSIRSREKFILYVLLSLNNAEDWYTSKKIKMLDIKSLNLHHIFPYSKGKRRKPSDKKYLSRIGNLTFITEETNKRIGVKKPLEYFEDLENIVGIEDSKNKLRSHFIPYNKRLWKPNKGRDYNKRFIEEREKAMIEFMNNTVIEFLKEYIS